MRFSESAQSGDAERVPRVREGVQRCPVWSCGIPPGPLELAALGTTRRQPCPRAAWVAVDLEPGPAGPGQRGSRHLIRRSVLFPRSAAASLAVRFHPPQQRRTARCAVDEREGQARRTLTQAGRAWSCRSWRPSTVPAAGDRKGRRQIETVMDEDWWTVAGGRGEQQEQYLFRGHPAGGHTGRPGPETSRSAILLRCAADEVSPWRRDTCAGCDTRG